MVNLKLIDNAFPHQKTCSPEHLSKYITWDRSPSIDNKEIVVFTDQQLYQAQSIKFMHNIKVGWLLEPIDIMQQSYYLVLNEYYLFDLILTHNKYICNSVPNASFCTNDMCWIKKEDFYIYNKNKNISIIASNKNDTFGHKLRHNIISKYKNNIDIYGRVYNPIEYKLSGLKDYRFSFAIENSIHNNYYSEKIIDCLVCGTVPIYFGSPSIGDIFDKNGLIIIKNESDITNCIKDIEEHGEEIYNNMLPSIKRNFEIAQNHLVAEDAIYKILISKGMINDRSS